MVFNSFEYLLFFPAVVLLYFATPHRFRWIIVLVGSYFFYAYWHASYTLLLLFTTFLDWSLALVMDRFSEKKKRFTVLWLSISANLLVLFFFKYFDFASRVLWDLSGSAGDPFVLNLLLPIGISFYTFQSLAYIIDVYRKDLPPERNFFRYAAFVSFFPHLVSGPILRPSNIIPQLHEKKTLDWQNLRVGLFLIGTGLIKKVVIADSLGTFVENAYGAPESLSGATLLLATYFFAFQIYCDFAGYTDIAIGSARILGYTIPENFRQPYFSESIREFWRRWHISLSSWLRDYLYIPLGGNRKGNGRTYLNLIITMVLGGLWHGAAWTFAAWGLLHGSVMSVERALEPLRIKVRIPRFLSRACKILTTFHIVILSWIFFRAESFSDAWLIIKKIATDFGSLERSLLSPSYLTTSLILIAALLVFDLLETKNILSHRIPTLRWHWQVVFIFAVILILTSLGVESGPQFIYFQF